jgi:glycerate 2-kinase
VLMCGTTAYVESAQACGLQLTEGRRAEEASSYGVGELIRYAVDAGAVEIVLGLGGSGTTDGGAGALAALGVTASGDLTRGSLGLAQTTDVDLAPARDLVSTVSLLVATDVDNALTGLFGTAKVYGPQKGIADDRLRAVDAALEAFSAFDRRTALRSGAGAAGGLGFALMSLGAEQRPGVRLVAESVGLPARVRQADLAITGEGAFDFSSRAGKVPYGVAEVAAEALRPCIALAGKVLVGAREMRAIGIESAYSMADLAGEARALGDPAATLADLAERVARTWSR